MISQDLKLVYYSQLQVKLEKDMDSIWTLRNKLQSCDKDFWHLKTGFWNRGMQRYLLAELLYVPPNT